MIKQECIGIPDMILLLMIFCFKKIKIKAEIVLSPGGAYFLNNSNCLLCYCHTLVTQFATNENAYRSFVLKDPAKLRLLFVEKLSFEKMLPIFCQFFVFSVYCRGYGGFTETIQVLICLDYNTFRT